jgi:hypothetical protein
MTPEEIKAIADELARKIVSTDTTESGEASSTVLDAKQLNNKLTETQTLVNFGFIILIVMVATIFIALQMWLTGMGASNLDKMYEWHNAQQEQINNLNNQNELFKKCLKTGQWGVCLN